MCDGHVPSLARGKSTSTTSMAIRNSHFNSYSALRGASVGPQNHYLISKSRAYVVDHHLQLATYAAKWVIWAEKG